MMPTDQPYLWREAILRDPSGNQIKLYWAEVKDGLSPHSASAASILGANEVRIGKCM